MDHKETSSIEPFEIRSYGWKELACLYAPDLQPASATKLLHRWIAGNKKLQRALAQAGWRKGMRGLTPRQVGLIVQCLGEP